jgi:hypothetical protein
VYGVIAGAVTNSWYVTAPADVRVVLLDDALHAQSLDVLLAHPVVVAARLGVTLEGLLVDLVGLRLLAGLELLEHQCGDPLHI